MATLDQIARSCLERSYAPYSGRPAAAVALLSDGSWMAGVRVENASFSLTVTAAVNAVTSAVAAGRSDIVALYSTEREQEDYVSGVLGGRWMSSGDRLIVLAGSGSLPEPSGELDSFPQLVPPGPMTAARLLSERAVVSQSDFPVSCILELADGRAIPGVNVELECWSGILCAERNALGTWVSAGRPDIVALHLSCLRDDTGTPCGACRQWLVELVPGIPVHMDRGEKGIETARPGDLLPGAFTGRSLRPGGRG